MTQLAPASQTTAPSIAAPPTTQPVGSPNPKRTVIILVTLLLGQFMAVLDTSIVNVAIPSIRHSLGAGGSSLQLIVSGYVITYAVLLVTGARLGDRFGQRTMFCAGLALFTLTSLACGLSWNTVSLISFRFLQGIGAAAMIPQVMTMIQRTFTGIARARALSAYAAVISCGMVAGQIVGGLIVSANLAGSSWRGVFLVNVPIGVVLLVLAPRILPAPGPRGDRRLDLAGLAVLTPSVLLLVLPLVLGHEQHWPVWTWIALAASVAGFAGFALVERRVHRRGGEPLFAERVLRARGLVLSAATLLLVMANFSGWMFVTAIHLQNTLGYSPLHAGLLFIPCGGVFALAGLNWERIPNRLHPLMIPAGLVLGAATTAGLGLLLGGGHGMGVPELIVFGVMGLGFGLAFSPLMNRALSTVPPALAADASGILVTSVQLGIVIGIASFGSLFLSIAGTSTVSASHAVGVTALVSAGVVLVASGLAARAAR